MLLWQHDHNIPTCRSLPYSLACSMCVHKCHHSCCLQSILVSIPYPMVLCLEQPAACACTCAIISYFAGHCVSRGRLRRPGWACRTTPDSRDATDAHSRSGQAAPHLTLRPQAASYMVLCTQACQLSILGMAVMPTNWVQAAGSDFFWYGVTWGCGCHSHPIIGELPNYLQSLIPVRLTSSSGPCCLCEDRQKLHRVHPSSRRLSTFRRNDIRPPIVPAPTSASAAYAGRWCEHRLEHAKYRWEARPWPHHHAAGQVRKGCHSGMSDA